DFDAELAGDHHLSAQWRQRLANELFIGKRTVNFGSIEECDAAFHGRADERDHRLLVRWETVALAHPHAAEPERRDLEIAVPKSALLHWSLLQGCTMTLPSLRRDTHHHDAVRRQDRKSTRLNSSHVAI